MRINIAIIAAFLILVLVFVGVMPVMAASSKIAIFSNSASISDTSKTTAGLSYYADALRAQGYTVEQINSPITTSKLDGYDALLIIGLDEYLSSSEKSAIEDFIENQEKGLLLSGGSPGVVNDLAQSFTGGSVGWLGNNIVCDPTDYEVYPKWAIIKTFYDHPITENVNKIIMYKGTNIPAAWTYGGIVGCAYSDDDSWLDEDGDYIYDSGESQGIQPVLAYSLWDKIVIVPDGNVFDNSDADGDGVVAFNEYDNDILGLNIVKWLIGGSSNGAYTFQETFDNLDEWYCVVYNSAGGSDNDPAPQLDTTMGRSAPSLDVNGNDWCGNGAYTKKTFDYTKGLTIEFDGSSLIHVGNWKFNLPNRR